MDSHIQGPFKSGYGAQVSCRAKLFDWSEQVANGEAVVELGEVQASPDKPALIEIGLAIVTPPDGTNAWVAVSAAPVSTGIPTNTVTTDDSTNVPEVLVVMENYRLYGVFATGADPNTGGSVAVYARVSGLGQFPITV